MMRAAIFTIDSGIYKAKAESAAASALKRMLEQVSFPRRGKSLLQFCVSFRTRVLWN